MHLALCLQPPTRNMLDRIAACLVGDEKQGGLRGWSPHLAGVCGCLTCEVAVPLVTSQRQQFPDLHVLYTLSVSGQK